MKENTINMIIKQIPQDFIVEEIFDINSIDKKEKEDETYYYFKLTKTNYSQVRALETVAKIFGISRKRVGFAGTKDKIGITTQMICLSKINEKTFDNNIEYFNRYKDLKLEFIGKYNSRINLGDNLGNKFNITIRNLNKEEIENAKLKIENIEKEGVYNYFDSQRFGFANNSHIIGKYLLQNKLENAVYEILTSISNNPKEDNVTFNKFLKENWGKIKQADEEILTKAMAIIPGYLNDEKRILGFLKKYKNDFSGAFKTVLHKKLRTLYLNAYQSYIFNCILDEIKNKNLKTEQKEILLVNSNFNETDEIKKIVEKLLEKDELTFDSFNLKHMPDLAHNIVAKRDIKSYPKNIKIIDIQNDDLNEKKMKMILEFELSKGEYATNIIKQIFI